MSRATRSGARARTLLINGASSATAAEGITATTSQAGAGVMDYFEIFLQRMLACRRAAKFLGCQFELVINKNRMI